MGDIMEINWTELGVVISRALMSLVALFIVTKLIGKKQVSELSLFDYVIGISIGNFAAEMTINTDSPEINGIIAVFIFGLIAYLVSIATMKSIILRRFFIGTPTILIQKGKILEKNLKRSKMDVNDLLEQIRIGGYFNLDEVDYAIMEANGKVSIFPKGENKPATLKDLKLKVEKQSLCSNVIIDGKIMHGNLENMHKDENWLIKQLKVKGKKLDEILLATLDLNEKLILYERNYNLKVDDVLE